jgi:hypothetical protein
VSVGRGIEQVIDHRYFDFIRVTFFDRAIYEAPNAPESIDTDFYCHIKPPGFDCNEIGEMIVSQRIQ